MSEKRVERGGSAAAADATVAGAEADRDLRAQATRKPLGPLLENVTQSATACLVTMVQGNLFAMTIGHWLIASRTGVVSGTIATVALWVAGSRRRSTIALLLALTTFGVDYFSHPSHFGSAVTEAVVTGLGAGALSFVVGKGLAWRQRSRTSAGRGGAPLPARRE